MALYILSVQTTIWLFLTVFFLLPSTFRFVFLNFDFFSYQITFYLFFSCLVVTTKSYLIDGS